LLHKKKRKIKFREPENQKLPENPRKQSNLGLISTSNSFEKIGAALLVPLKVEICTKNEQQARKENFSIFNQSLATALEFGVS